MGAFIAERVPHSLYRPNVACIEGELGFYIHSKGGGTPHRLKIRSPSFASLSILPKILPGHMVSDVVAILGSLDFVMGECDR